MTPDQRLLICVGTAWGILYAMGCFIAGIIAGNPYAWKLALVTAGACYLTYLAQLQFPRWSGLATFLVIASIIAGLASGLTLLVA